jgi:HAD superfamily hydrolase (TIGR01549 family)
VIRAILFDVGGPLNTEETHERAMDADLRAALEAAGFAISDEEYAAAWRWAIEAFAPFSYPAVVWKLTGEDVVRAPQVYAEVERRAQGRSLFEPREGVAELLGRLRAAGFRLGVAANQPASTLPVLARVGLAQYFDDLQVSETLRLRKPDPRLFLAICAALGVEPGECLMVGDRIDNDIVPARWLGMWTVRFRTGRHAEQRARTWMERPDAEVEDVRGLEAAIVEITGVKLGPRA